MPNPVILSKTITEAFNDTEIVFTYPDFEDKMLLIEEYQSWRKGKVVDNCARAALDPAQTALELEAFDENLPLNYPVFLVQPRGRIFGLMLCLKEKYGDDAEKIAKSIPAEADGDMGLTMKLWNLIQKTPPAEATDAAGQPAGTGKPADPNKQIQPDMRTYSSDPTSPA